MNGGGRTIWLGALALLLLALFSPVIFGGKTLLMSAWNAPSITASGAFYGPPDTPSTILHTTDPGAPAWVPEPLFKLISDQIWREHSVPLWNPYTGFGAPLAAAMQAQPFYPLAALLSVHVSPRTYSLFVIARLFVAGALMLLFARLFLPAAPAAFSAVTFMLSGYFIIALDMPHISVEVLAPGMLLVIELLLRKNSWAAVAGGAAMILLCTVGGMPESMFLVIAFGCIYFLFRALTMPEFQEPARYIKFAALLAFGFALSAFLLLPFVELLRVAFDVHQPGNVAGDQAGLVAMSDWRLMILYLFPMAFGPVGNLIFGNFSGWTGSFSYWGMLASFFAVSALVMLFAPRHLAQPAPLRSLTVFFAVMLALMILKHFGHPIINWIGALPVAEMIVYHKYLEPLISMCVAMLAGIGLSVLRRDTVRYFIVAFVLTTGAAGALAVWSLPGVLGVLPQHGAFFYLSIIGGFGVVVGAVVIIAWATATDTDRGWRRASYGVLALLCVELSFSFVVPSFYVAKALPDAAKNPYAGAPYIDFIKGRNDDLSRIFARDSFLFPNWSAAFSIADARALDAVYYNRYRDFMRAFLLPPGLKARRHGDMSDRFLGTEFPFRFDTEIEQRFLALSSIRYLIGLGDFGAGASDARFRKVYDKEARVFEFDGALPRATLFRSVELIADGGALDRLRDPSFDIRRALVSSDDATEGRLLALASAAPSPPVAAKIVRYESQRVWIVADTDAPSILMLTDTNYPGWRALVNGVPAPMLTVNYLFRGVVVPAGTSAVEFVYRPMSYRIGGLISLAAALGLAGFVVLERCRRVAPEPALS